MRDQLGLDDSCKVMSFFQFPVMEVSLRMGDLKIIEVRLEKVLRNLLANTKGFTKMLE